MSNREEIKKRYTDILARKVEEFMDTDARDYSSTNIRNEELLMKILLEAEANPNRSAIARTIRTIQKDRRDWKKETK